MNKALFFSYETYIFDFDGTLVLSNEIKKKGFFECVKSFKNGNEILENIMKNDNNIDRFTIFKIIAEKLCNKQDEMIDLYENLLKNYDFYTVNKIIKLRPVIGSIELLNHLRNLKKNLYINSATPYKSLVKTLNGREMTHYFDEIFGMENGKKENIKKIKKHSRSNKKSILMIGDGIDDMKAAEEFDISFYPVGFKLTGRVSDFLGLINS